MRAIFLGLFIVANVTPVANAADACYAPPIINGPACRSSRGFVGGSRSDTIRYSIDVKGDTAVFCYGLAISTCPAQSCSWTYWNLGLVNNGVSPLIWGANAGVPAIYCRGVPFGSALSWSWSVGARCASGCGFNETSDSVLSGTSGTIFDVIVDPIFDETIDSKFNETLILALND